MKKTILLALALGVAGSIASAQPQSGNATNANPAQAQSKQSGGFVPSADTGHTPTQQERKAITSVTTANNAASATKSSGASTGQQGSAQPQAVSGRNVK